MIGAHVSDDAMNNYNIASVRISLLRLYAILWAHVNRMDSEQICVELLHLYVLPIVVLF